NHDRFECQTAIDSDAILQSCTCETENMNKVNLRLASIASLGGLLFGYETAVISGAIKHLTA
ncbi:hypothetical protein PWI26_22790, partial [Salmonella enterica subsp. enterica]